MTAQQPDKIFIEGQEHPLFCNPLEDFFTITSFNPGFMSPHTANYRGYIASWEIIDQKLHIVNFLGWRVNRATPGELDEVGLEYIFPEEAAPLFAKWFTGTLIVPLGKMLHYIHMGYESI